MDRLKSELKGLISPDSSDRGKALYLLTDKIINNEFDSDCNSTIIDFFGERLSDISCLFDTLTCAHKLLLNIKFQEGSLMSLLHKINEAILFSEQSQSIRMIGLDIFNQIFNEIKNNQELVSGASRIFLSQTAGERDPRNLVRLFELFYEIVTSGASRPILEDIFEAVFCYFPISFKPPPNDPFGIKPELLISKLDKILVVIFFITPDLVIEALCERFETSDEFDLFISTISQLFSNDGIFLTPFYLRNVETVNSTQQISFQEKDSPINRLIKLLISQLKSNSKQLVQLFQSVPYLKSIAKKNLEQYSHSIFINGSEEYPNLPSDEIVAALFELGCITEEIWSSIEIDPFSYKFLLFLKGIKHSENSPNLIEKAPTMNEGIVDTNEQNANTKESSNRMDFCARLEKKIEFHGNLSEVSFLSASVDVLKRLKYRFLSSEKIYELQKASFDLLLKQAGIPLSIFNTLLETELLEMLAPSLHSLFISIQSLGDNAFDYSKQNYSNAPACKCLSGAEMGFMCHDDPLQLEKDDMSLCDDILSLKQMDKSCYSGSLDTNTSGMFFNQKSEDFQEKDICDLLKRLTKLDSCYQSSADQLLLTKASKHPCVWIRLVCIKKTKDKKLLSYFLSDHKRIVRQLASLQLLNDDSNSMSSGCCRK